MPSPTPAVPVAVATPGSSFALQVISLDGLHWDGDVREASVPGAAGRLGFLPGHTPLMAPLSAGLVRLFPADNTAMVEIHVSGGYVEVQPDRVIVLADLAARSDSLDEALAEEARAAAHSPMAAAFTDVDYAQLHAELAAQLAQAARLSRPR
ncbi:ATP synthase F1 subunit epsilon [Stenotrophomonas sp. YAU14D1_LEIMI4_1]|nr:ATP synthase F1 subunit epsilon [Stenotrophomonas sp. YAU14D1_LEIMI4_1]